MKASEASVLFQKMISALFGLFSFLAGVMGLIVLIMLFVYYPKHCGNLGTVIKWYVIL